MAELSCEQCAEIFCSRCATATHHRGRMAEHQLRPHAPTGAGGCGGPGGAGAGTQPAAPAGGAATGGPSCGTAIGSSLALSTYAGRPGPLGPLLDAAAAAGASTALGPPSARGLSPRRADLAPLQRRFLRCPAHPEEPLQYFCLKCQCDCVCAECVLNGTHRGHEVLNVREAVRRLPERVAELATAARLRAEEIAGAAERVRAGRQELALVAARGGKDLQAATERLAGALHREEEAVLAEVAHCAADVAEILRADCEPLIGEALVELRRATDAGAAAEALAWYARLRQAIAAPQQNRPSADPDRLAGQLRGQLRRGFEGRLNGLAGLTRCVAELRAPELVAAAASGGLVAAGMQATPTLHGHRL